MVRAVDPRSARRRVRIAILLLVTLSATLILAPRSLAAGTPYEPNDTILNAAGSLTTGQTYVAGMETPGDRDFFYFYATSPRASQVVLTIRNLGGSSNVSDIDVTILDSASTPVAAQAFIGKGEERAVAAALQPQKYFVEVTANEGFGDSYSLSAGGGAGAFGPYAQIAARCASATAAVAAGRTGLDRAKAKLQRATARLRRTRYGTGEAREGARVAHRRARAKVRAKRRALKDAGEAREPWCFIAQ